MAARLGSPFYLPCRLRTHALTRPERCMRALIIFDIHDLGSQEKDMDVVPKEGYRIFRDAIVVSWILYDRDKTKRIGFDLSAFLTTYDYERTCQLCGRRRGYIMIGLLYVPQEFDWNQEIGKLPKRKRKSPTNKKERIAIISPQTDMTTKFSAEFPSSID